MQGRFADLDLGVDRDRNGEVGEHHTRHLVLFDETARNEPLTEVVRPREWTGDPAVRLATTGVAVADHLQRGLDGVGRDVRHADEVRERVREIGHATAHAFYAEIFRETRHRRVCLEARLDRDDQRVIGDGQEVTRRASGARGG